jgi:hypothetical protein
MNIISHSAQVVFSACDDNNNNEKDLFHSKNYINSYHYTPPDGLWGKGFIGFLDVNIALGSVKNHGGQGNV